MASPRDFVYDEQGEMLPSDSSPAAERRKVLDDERRVVADAESSSKAPAKAKPKAPVVTKEQLAKSGFTNLRDYLNDKKGLKRRDGKAPEKASAPSAKGAMIQSMDTDMMRTAGRTAAKEAGASRRATAEAAAKAKDKKTFGALTRTETNRSQREAAMRKDKKSYAKGGSINGIAKRGLTKCKTV